MSTVKTNVRPLNVIAQEIVNEWDKVNYSAKPYLAAMLTLNSFNDMYYEDSAKSIVLYFLNNAKTWKGETARRIKAELNTMCK